MRALFSTVLALALLSASDASAWDRRSAMLANASNFALMQQTECRVVGCGNGWGQTIPTPIGNVWATLPIYWPGFVIVPTPVGRVVVVVEGRYPEIYKDLVSEDNERIIAALFLIESSAITQGLVPPAREGD